MCRRHRANEKFTGKGHAKHICKDCERKQRRLKKFQKGDLGEKEELAMIEGESFTDFLEEAEIIRSI